MKKLILGVAAATMIFVGLTQPQTVTSQIEPTPECMWVDGQWLCISHIEATLPPFVPTSTPVPTQPAPTATPTIVIQPFPTALPTVYYVYLPYVRKTIRSGE